MADAQTTILHASTVRLAGQGILILGPSGVGKSSLALQLMALGAVLVSDDRTQVSRQDDTLIAEAPSTIAGMIEARGVGLLRAEIADPTPLSLVIDLGQEETARLPERHWHSIFKITLPCLWAVRAPHFAPAILQYVNGGLIEGL